MASKPVAKTRASSSLVAPMDLSFTPVGVISSIGSERTPTKVTFGLL